MEEDRGISWLIFQPFIEVPSTLCSFSMTAGILIPIQTILERRFEGSFEGRRDERLRPKLPAGRGNLTSPETPWKVTFQRPLRLTLTSGDRVPKALSVNIGSDAGRLAGCEVRTA